MAARQWTQAQRKEQSNKIRQWQPWKKSTGPISSEGKAISSKNSYKSDSTIRLLKQIRTLLKNHKVSL
jgi:hypothetical protein